MTQQCWNCGVPAAFVHRPPLPATQKIAHDFTHLRTSNDAPLDSEIPGVREIISDGEERLATLENRVRDLEAAIANLVHKRDEAAKHLREYRAILHPLRRAPPELICEIFAMTLDAVDDSTHIKGTGYKPPWYLGHICRSWRLWALTYPPLWHHITIPSAPAHPIERDILETLLLRSSNAMLNVCWTVEDQDRRSVDRDLADLALANCSRWATLRLDLSLHLAADPPNWLHPVKGCLPTLRRLDMLSASKIGGLIPDVFSVAPSLCQVLLTDWALSYFSPDIQIPWDQITHYRGAFPEESQLNILRAATKLVQCAISFERPTLAPGESVSITLSLLRRLYIEKPVHLRHLTTPSLEELYCAQLDKKDTRVLLPLVNRSHCQLQKLVLMSCLISSELFTALRGLPNLAYLLIEATDRSASRNIDLFGEMVIAGNPRDLCPNLSCLVFGSCGRDLAEDREQFLHMAQSRFRRSPRGPRLTYLRVFDLQPDADIPAATKELRDEGFDADSLSETEFELLIGKGFFP
ncbi:hypothetical protein DFH06DRAFT_372535 [Mycena polygramma]|nr:hypothetical protein DFH06DRAFT_372535 [Mycena polygramma]